MNFVPCCWFICVTLPALAMLMIARCGVTAETHHVDCWSVSILQHQILPASSGCIHEFCTLLLVHLCNTPALAMLMIARCGVTAETHHVDCWSVSSPAAQNLASIIKGVYHMNFVPCC
jgi:hypothetical protein